MKCKIDADAVAVVVVVNNNAIAASTAQHSSIARLHAAAQIRILFVIHFGVLLVAFVVFVAFVAYVVVVFFFLRNRCRKYAPMTKSIEWALSSFNHLFSVRTKNNNNNNLLQNAERTRARACTEYICE